MDLVKRAYWGESLLGGEASALNMGPLPGGGIWHRLEIPVDDLGLAGKTIVQVEAAISNGQVWLDRFAVSGAEAPALITAFTSSHPSPQTAGTTITWTVAAAGSADPLEYRFEREDAGLWSVVQPYGSGNAYSWTPTASDAGDHALRVSVRNGGSLSDFDDTASLPMTITPSSGSLRAPRATIAERIRRMFVDNDRAPISLGVTYDAVSATSVEDRRRYSLYTPELNLLAETVASASATPAVEYEYIWFGGQPAAQVEVSTGSIDSYFNDHLGTPLLQTSSIGAVVWRAEYEPYGAVQAFRDGVSKHQPLRFPGQESDEGSEASYNIFRWYRAGWGRYTQPDPMGLSVGSSTNLFSYVDGRPTFATDRLGLVSSQAGCPQNACCTPAAMKQEFEKAWNYALMHQKDHDWSLEGSCTGESCGTMADKLRQDIEQFIKPKCFITSSQLTKGGLLGKAINPITKFLFGINGWVHYVVKFTPCNANLTPNYIDLYTHPNYGPLPPSEELDQP